jgi:hypothetical protein
LNAKVKIYSPREVTYYGKRHLIKVQIVREIRDKKYEETKEKTDVELIAYYEKKSRNRTVGTRKTI